MLEAGRITSECFRLARTRARSGLEMDDVDVAIAAAEAGAAVVLRWFGAGWQRLDKSGGDFATTADVEAEQAMLSVLRQERPEDGLLGEETGRGGSSQARRVWLLDPLCGTLNYAVRTRLVAVNVALRDGARFVAAAVAEPFDSEVFWADARRALRRAGGRDAPLVSSSHSHLVDLNLDPPFPNGPAFSAARLAGRPDFLERFKPRVVSSSIALAWVATGQRAAYVTDGDVRDSVHFAAGIALCEAAGCTVTDLQGRRVGEGPTGLVAAADAATHAALLQIIRQGND
jgi:myo-inositol-1(or 4)-monophosphatase